VTAGGGCPLPVAPVCDLVSGAGTGLAKDVLSAIVSWIVAGASWLLDQLGNAMSSSTSVHLGASWFVQHYAVMAALAAVVAVPMLLLSAVQAIYRQSPALLARAALVHLPLAGLLTGVAVQLVQLSLTATNALCAAVSQGTGDDIDQMLRTVATVLVTTGPTLPGFVLGLGALLVVIGALTLWIELIVRAAAVYVAVLFLPLAMASLVWPAVSHWCRRLVETLASIVLSKFVVVAVLSLTVGALANGSGFGTLLTAGALLLLAAFMPFTLLRLVPMIESGAALQLEGARQRLRQGYAGVPRSAASFALNKAKGAGLQMGEPGTGTDIDPGVPGTGDASSGGRGGDGGGPGPGGSSGWSSFGGPDDPGGGGGRDGGGAMDNATGRSGNGQEPFGPLPREALSPTFRMPPGDIPMWESDLEYTAAEVDRLWNMTEPLPGISGNLHELPMWGGTEPPSRFEPGPKDDWWTSEELVRQLSTYGRFVDESRIWGLHQPPVETPEDAAMWDRAVARDTRGDDEW
jgi:hypothetical protein